MKPEFYKGQEVIVKEWEALVRECGTRCEDDRTWINTSPSFTDIMRACCGRTGVISKVFNDSVHIIFDGDEHPSHWFFPFASIASVQDDLEDYAVDNEDFARFLNGAGV